MAKRYIDAERIDFSPLIDDFDRARAKVIIMGQPTADVVEVKHGEYIQKGAWHIECSVCRHILAHIGEAKNYCPNCGAKMDGRSDGDE